MLNSKALKSYKYEKGKLYLWWIESKLSKWYYGFTWFFRKPYRNAKKMYQWYVNVFHNDFDFDAHCLYAIMGYKLQRVENILLNGHAVQEEKDLKALRLAIKLAKRLEEDNYDGIFGDRHAKKWGELKTWFEPIEGSTNKLWCHSRPNAVTEEQKEQEREDIRKSWVLSNRMMQREQKWFYGILDKYLRVWWD